MVYLKQECNSALELYRDEEKTFAHYFIRKILLSGNRKLSYPETRTFFSETFNKFLNKKNNLGIRI